ncbi:ArsR/SmtB family transcription factor [Micromonospora coxensis]|uniref:ArsR/SmtB family transcription factor n=1 Tax=Micromonospora coxensis TaxID=356852 RepID=UPI003444560D
MVTLRLTATDLGRIVLRSAPAVLLELGAAGQRLLQPTVPEHLAAWRARTRAALRPVMRPYLDLCRRPDWFPDFLTPPRLGSELEAALTEVDATPTEVLAAELRPAIEAGHLPPRVGPLAAGDPAARRRLRDAMVAFHAVAVAPYWDEIVAAVHADRAVRGRAMVDTGIDRVLRELSPHLHFASAGQRYELSYECAVGAGVVLSPAGRGVTLVPSYLVPQPAVLDDPAGPMVLTYPIRPTRRELTTGRPLADLLGRTRAAVLGAVADGPSTSELARRLGISVASASQHAATLRQAGLIDTHRAGPSVLHTLTPLGGDLLRAGGGR